MTPELDPCFYYISVRGFDRILSIVNHLFGGFIDIANQVRSPGLLKCTLINFRTQMRYTVAKSD